MTRPYPAFEEFSKSLKYNQSYPPKDGNYSKMYKEIRELIEKQYDKKEELQDYVLYLATVKEYENGLFNVQATSSLGTGFMGALIGGGITAAITYGELRWYVIAVIVFFGVGRYMINGLRKTALDRSFNRLLHTLASQCLDEMLEKEKKDEI